MLRENDLEIDVQEVLAGDVAVDEELGEAGVLRRLQQREETLGDGLDVVASQLVHDSLDAADGRLLQRRTLLELREETRLHSLAPLYQRRCGKMRLGVGSQRQTAPRRQTRRHVCEGNDG